MKRNEAMRLDGLEPTIDDIFTISSNLSHPTIWMPDSDNEEGEDERWIGAATPPLPSSIETGRFEYSDPKKAPKIKHGQEDSHMASLSSINTSLTETMSEEEISTQSPNSSVVEGGPETLAVIKEENGEEPTMPLFCDNSDIEGELVGKTDGKISLLTFSPIKETHLVEI